MGVGVTAAAWALLQATFVASFVEAVEAATIIMATGFTRNWRSTWIGVATALVALAIVTAIFGQWLRKAILRASHRKSIHDEEKIFRDQQEEAAQRAGDRPAGFDMFSFMVSLRARSWRAWRSSSSSSPSG
jgi:uncharacterized membrane protein